MVQWIFITIKKILFLALPTQTWYIMKQQSQDLKNMLSVAMETMFENLTWATIMFMVSRNTGLVNSLSGNGCFSFFFNSVAMATNLFHILYLNIHNTPSKY